MEGTGRQGRGDKKHMRRAGLRVSAPALSRRSWCLLRPGLLSGGLSSKVLRSSPSFNLGPLGAFHLPSVPTSL